jgi:DNA gyrase subunit A
LQLGPNEKVSAILNMGDSHAFDYLMMVTREGTIKKTTIKDFENIRRSGLIAIKLKGEDLLEWVKPVSTKEEVFITTANGQAIRFKEDDLRPMGRNASGVRGVRLKSKDHVVAMNTVTEEDKKDKVCSLVVTENGFGKMTPVKDYRIQSRGGSGIRTAKVTTKNGPVVWSTVISPDKLPEEVSGDLLIISDKGQVIRLPLSSVSTTGRDTQGVRLMRFKSEGDKVASVALV